MENGQTKPPRFAILRHSKCIGRLDHYDIVVEQSLGTDSEEIALAKYESQNIGQTIEAVYDRNVRRRYLTYEGTMGEGRGIISRLYSGNYQTLQDGSLLLFGKESFFKLNIKKGESK